MNDTIYVVNEEDESKLEHFWRKLKEKAHDTVQWVANNKDVVAIITPIAIGGLKVVSVVTKAVGKRINLRKEEAVKNMYCYDPSLGHYWALKRELSSKEWLNIDRRRKNGERLSEILEDLKVLKK